MKNYFHRSIVIVITANIITLVSTQKPYKLMAYNSNQQQAENGK